MPYSKKQYSLGLAFIVFLIALALLNSHSHNNPSPSLENQEEIINNDCQEENIRENSNHSTILDNTIVNLIIFLLIFLIVFVFVYTADFISPVARNNKQDIIDPTKRTIKKSVFRKKGIFSGTRNVLKESYFCFCYEEKEKQEEVKIDINTTNTNNINENNNNNSVLKLIHISQKLADPNEIINIDDVDKPIFGFEDGFEIKNCKDKTIIRYQNDVHLETGQKYIEKIKKKFPEEKEKEEYLYNEIEKDSQFSILDKTSFDCGPQIQEYFNQPIQRPTYEKNYEYFQGKPNFFNPGNIIAFLLSSGFFFVSFDFFYFVLYFFYALIDAFIEAIEEENKWLFALYKTWDTILLSNFRGLLKAIPLSVFLIGLLLSGVIFFGKNTFFIPAISDKNNGNTLILIHRYGNNMKLLKKFLNGKTTTVPIDENYDLIDFWNVPSIESEGKGIPVSTT